MRSGILPTAVLGGPVLRNRQLEQTEWRPQSAIRILHGLAMPSHPGRPYSDQFDVAAVSAAIAAGETTPLRAYQAYAATAGRPYARSSFEQLWRNHARRAGAVAVDPPASEAELYVQSEAYWAEHVAPKPTRVLTLTGDSVALRVKGGGLQITDPQFSGARHLYFAPSARKPNAIVLSGWAE